jgi:ABC-2 type transport system ATP-binding protein
LIKTENLTKIYNGVKAVDSISLEVGKGEVCGFIGPNGSGKTTTICMMVGLVEPTEGRCLINDIEVTKNPIGVKRTVGYLPDGFGFYGSMTASQNLKFFSRLYEIKDADAKIKGLLDYVGLSDVKKPVDAYSKGMLQRLGLARALINDPQVIFMDEPTNGLDPEGVVQFRKVVKDQASLGKTVFFSSHNLDEVHHVCNTLCIISKGKVIAQGTQEEVRKKMRKEERYNIVVKVRGAMPKLSNPDIVSAVYEDGRATIQAKSDIRDYILEEISRERLPIQELRIDVESLEDLFLETVYRSG